VAVDGEESRRELRDCFDCALAVRKAAHTKPARIAFDLFEEDLDTFDDD